MGEEFHSRSDGVLQRSSISRLASCVVSQAAESDSAHVSINGPEVARRAGSTEIQEGTKYIKTVNKLKRENNILYAN